jgi:hypothetical protein
MDAAPHFAIVGSHGGDAVEVWSTERLPYEPRGWMLEMRNALRIALREMRGRDGALLAGVYGSQVDDFCDVENVLVYNVGAANFATTASTGLPLERGRICPPAPIELDGEARHYACYSLAPRGQGFALWKDDGVVASWTGVEMPPLSETTRPSVVWHALRTAEIRAKDRPTATGLHGLELVVGAAPGERLQPAKFVKPLVDGVIAALHSHDGSALHDLVDRLSTQLPSTSASAVEALLLDERATPLGRRRLLWPWGKGVQWNPADDLCVALEVRVEASARRDLRGRLFEVAAL